MPPPNRNHRTPTAGDTPASTPACSLVTPRAIAAQTRCRCSRLPTGGRPGERITGRPVSCDAHPFGLPIATLLHRALRRPVESAQHPGDDCHYSPDGRAVASTGTDNKVITALAWSP